MKWVIGLMAAVTMAMSSLSAAQAADAEACDSCVAAKSCDDANVDSCIGICTRLSKGDQRLASCSNVCRAKSNQCIAAAKVSCKDSCAIANTGSETSPAPEQASEPARTKPAIPSLNSKRAMMKERDIYADMLAAVRFGNEKVIRHLIQVKGLSPTYVYTYEFSPQTRQFEGSVTRLWLNDILNDASSPVGNAANADRTVALFLELGMDVNATHLATVPAENGGSIQAERTVWGPSLRAIEKVKDRDAHIRALDIALKAGLKPNPEIGSWLFTELPQVCGRDRSKFAIQVVDLLVQHLGASLQDSFWRMGQNGPETVSDVIDRSFSRAAVPGTAYEKEQIALQEQVWENCAPLAQRITRYLSKGT